MSSASEKGKKHLSSCDEIALLEKEIEDWQSIADAFNEGSREKARELILGKDRRCGICSRFKEFKEEDGRQVLNCKKCPIVKATGHSCAHWWRDKGFKKHIKKDDDSEAMRK